jgi:hypothetical protein
MRWMRLLWRFDKHWGVLLGIRGSEKSTHRAAQLASRGAHSGQAIDKRRREDASETIEREDAVANGDKRAIRIDREHVVAAEADNGRIVETEHHGVSGPPKVIDAVAANKTVRRRGQSEGEIDREIDGQCEDMRCKVYVEAHLLHRTSPHTRHMQRLSVD